MTTVWEGDYGIPVLPYTAGTDKMSVDELQDLMIPTAYPSTWVLLRQVATLHPNGTTSLSNNTIRCACSLSGAT